MATQNTFQHDLVIAGDDGSVYHIPTKELDKYKVDQNAFENDKGWALVKTLLQTGVSTAAVPDRLGWPWQGPCGPKSATCYVVNLASFAKTTGRQPDDHLKYWLTEKP